MKRFRGVVIIGLIFLLFAFAAGCGGTTTSSKPVLESEKKLVGMYTACQNIALTDGATHKTITVTGIKAMPPLETQAILKRSNGMTHTDTWKGTPLNAILDANGVARPFKELKIQAWDGYVGRVSFDVASKPDTMMAYMMDGKPIAKEDGPVRLVVPSEDGFYWIRMITKIEVIR